MGYQIMFYGGMAGAVLTLVIAILVYVKLNIAQVITDLTGWNWPGAGRKARKRTSSNTDTSTKPTTKEIHVRKNVEKEVAAGEQVEPTERMASGSVAADVKKQKGLEPTALLSQESVEPTALLNHESLEQGSMEQTALLAQEKPILLAKNQRETVAAAASPGRNNTTLLSDAPTETTILSDWTETTVLTADPDETTLLDDMNETTLLTEQEEPLFKKQVDIVVIHSETVI